MEKTSTERETHDFMNVESFSQLPFMRRPAPAVKEKGGIRLFGKEFGGEYSSSTTYGDNEQSSDQSAANNNINNNPHEQTSKDSDHNGESTRKFECHYCCRNFPTSQALGGHQNAHKRERQHAKRAHLQSAMLHGGLAAEAHLYAGLLNHHHRGVGSLPTAPAPASALAYHSWPGKSSNNSNPRFYGSSGHAAYSYSQPIAPINGSPLASLWRIPAAAAAVHHHSSPSFNRPLPLFADDDLKPPQAIISTNSQLNRLGYEASKPNKMQDHVSLDLHL